MNNFEQKQNLEKDVLRRAELADSPLILELLNKNLAKNLSEEEKKDGLYFEPTQDELVKIINDTGIYLCLRGNDLKGYFITMSRELASTMPMTAELLSNADEVLYNDRKIVDYKYALLVQILIAKEYRGGRTFHKLHDTAQAALADQGFEIALAEISDNNTTSLAVHRNYSDVGIYMSLSGMKWHMIVVNLSAD